MFPFAQFSPRTSPYSRSTPTSESRSLHALGLLRKPKNESRELETTTEARRSNSKGRPPSAPFETQRRIFRDPPRTPVGHAFPCFSAAPRSGREPGRCARSAIALECACRPTGKMPRASRTGDGHEKRAFRGAAGAAAAGTLEKATRQSELTTAPSKARTDLSGASAPKGRGAR